MRVRDDLLCRRHLDVRLPGLHGAGTGSRLIQRLLRLRDSRLGRTDAFLSRTHALGSALFGCGHGVPRLRIQFAHRGRRRPVEHV